jgi:serine-type D-Ala-D-Ala carboxypeptidase (penicillin-binding protein 5/6)
MKLKAPLFALILAAAAPAGAATETPARQAILLDLAGDAILFEKNADERIAPSSLTKMMTTYLAFEALEEGRLALDDLLPVSERAWRTGGSRMFLEPGDRVRVEDLLRGVVVQSGNDAAVAIAEGLAGSEDAFAAAMTRKAQALGMADTNFANASGWPDPEHYSTARDLARLAVALIEDFPAHYPYHAERSFTHAGIKQGNRNPLLYRDMGADGIKTGHTEAAGYALAASTLRDGRRLVLVVSGLATKQARAQESARLLEWGYRAFKSYALFEPGEPIDLAETWLGASDTVPLVLDRKLVVTLTSEQRRDLAVNLLFEEPVPAPLERGDPIGTLTVSAPGMAPLERTVKAGADVPELPPVARAARLAGALVVGFFE